MKARATQYFGDSRQLKFIELWQTDNTYAWYSKMPGKIGNGKIDDKDFATLAQAMAFGLTLPELMYVEILMPDNSIMKLEFRQHSKLGRRLIEATA